MNGSFFKSKDKNKYEKLVVRGLTTSVLLLIVLLLILAWTEKPVFIKDDKEINTEKRIITYIAPQYENGPWKEIKEGFLDAAEACGFFPIWLPGDQGSTEFFCNNIRIAKNGGSDAIIINPFFLREEQSSLNFLKDTPVVCSIVKPEENHFKPTSFVGIDYTYTGAKIVKEFEAEKISAGNVAIVINTHFTGNELEIANNLFSQLQAQQPETKLVKIIETKATSALGTIMTNNDIRTVIIIDESDNDECAKELLAHEVEHGKTIVFYGTGSETCEKLIDMGVVDVLVVQSYYRVGYLAGEFAYRNSMWQIMPENHNFLPRVIMLSETEK